MRQLRASSRANLHRWAVRLLLLLTETLQQAMPTSPRPSASKLLGLARLRLAPRAGKVSEPVRTLSIAHQGDPTLLLRPDTLSYLRRTLRQGDNLAGAGRDHGRYSDAGVVENVQTARSWWPSAAPPERTLGR